MGRTRNRILGSLRLTRLRAKQALRDAAEAVTAERAGTPCPVPVRVDDRKPH